LSPSSDPATTKRFNTAGPCDSERHYLLPPLPRVPDARRRVDFGDYFVLHAPRQSGKTTFLRAFARALTESGAYAAVYVSCEIAEAAGDDVIAAQEAIVRRLAARGGAELAQELQPPPLPTDWTSATLLGDYLAAWCRACPRKVVLLLDEIDAVRGQALISVLRQLRDAFADRPARAPWSVMLCGLRDVREYKSAAGGDGDRLGTASPFNVKVASFTLDDFTELEVGTLLAQHAEATGQRFTPEAMARIYELTGGQPWLVNALARELVEELRVVGDVGAPEVDAAKERLILARVTHLDSLAARLSEPRVRRVIEPLIAGELAPADEVFDDDVGYVVALGLVKTAPLRIANPIYREVVARVLSASAQHSVIADPRGFIASDGRFDVDVLLREFASFWTEQGEELTSTATYREASAQLVLMAYLQRVVNGGGVMTREYGLATRRIDLLVTWPYVDGTGKRRVQREALELKVWRDGRKDPLGEGLAQLDAYLDRLGLSEGTLLVFDRRALAPPIAERVHLARVTSPSGRPIRLLRA